MEFLCNFNASIFSLEVRGRMEAKNSKSILENVFSDHKNFLPSFIGRQRAAMHGAGRILTISPSRCKEGSREILFLRRSGRAHKKKVRLSNRIPQISLMFCISLDRHRGSLI